MEVINTTIAVTWAIPVDIVHLGAHVTVYSKLAPLRHMLQLCRRFRQDQDGVYIAQLPVELLECIVGFLETEHRHQAYLAWQEEYACFQDKCEPAKHLTRSGFEEAYAECLLEITRLYGHCCRDMEKHEVGYICRGVVDEINDTAASEYALVKESCQRCQVFTGHPTTGWPHDWHTGGGRIMGIAGSTVGYLCLPFSPITESGVLDYRSEENDYEYDDDPESRSGPSAFDNAIAVDSGTFSEVPDLVGARLTRTMGILGLQPSNQRVQTVRCTTKRESREFHSSPNDEAPATDGQWPKHMVLTRIEGG